MTQGSLLSSAPHLELAMLIRELKALPGILHWHKRHIHIGIKSTFTSTVCIKTFIFPKGKFLEERDARN
jgi:hypothetical protein